MPRNLLDKGILAVKNEILFLHGMVQRATNAALDSLMRKDFCASKNIFKNDFLINDKRIEIEYTCLKLIATQQPIANDLRFLASTLEVITDLERMGDYAKGIAKINLLIGKEPFLNPIEHLPEMKDLTLSMLERGVEAFIKTDRDMARKIPREDQFVDDLYELINKETTNLILEDGAHFNQANHILWAAHNLERMADRVSNICIRTNFVVTGKIEELDSEAGLPNLIN